MFVEYVYSIVGYICKFLDCFEVWYVDSILNEYKFRCFKIFFYILN